MYIPNNKFIKSWHMWTKQNFVFSTNSTYVAIKFEHYLEVFDSLKCWLKSNDKTTNTFFFYWYFVTNLFDNQ